MVSPISAVTSRAPNVKALSRVAPLSPRPETVEAAPSATSVAKTPSPGPGPGLRDALPAGYRNLAVPIGAASNAPLSGEEATLLSAYGPSSAALSSLPRLVGDRVPARILLREAQAEARSLAEARGETLEEFFESAAVVSRSRLPSRNGADAMATVRAALLVRDGERDTATIDIYLTKTGTNAFEATAYDREYASPSGGFPYAAPPLSVDRIQYDPAFQAVVSVAAGQSRRRAPSPDAGGASFGAFAASTAIGAATFVAVMLTLAADQPAFAATTALVGTAGFVYALRARAAG